MIGILASGMPIVPTTEFGLGVYVIGIIAAVAGILLPLIVSNRSVSNKIDTNTERISEQNKKEEQLRTLQLVKDIIREEQEDEFYMFVSGFADNYADDGERSEVRSMRNEFAAIRRKNASKMKMVSDAITRINQGALTEQEIDIILRQVEK